jgi:hypothetical protein
MQATPEVAQPVDSSPAAAAPQLGDTAGRESVCADCGAPVAGNYCSACGQETRIETPTVRQFVHELMDQYVAVEGKLGRTLRVLVSRPGQLTLDYLQGRRQRYVRPLKLYVSISVVFFALLGFLPGLMHGPIGHGPLVEFDDDKPTAQAETAAPASAPAKPAEDTDKTAGNKLKARLENDARSFGRLPPEQQKERALRKLLDDAPYAMFLLLPYSALLLRWLFRRSGLLYGVHLLFSLHVHCFGFIALALFLALHIVPAWVLFAVFGFYVFLALRRVYGGTPKRILWRMAVLAALYFPIVALTALSGLISAVLGGGA